MSVRRVAEIQPASFAFTPENLEWAKKQIAKYPVGRQASAVISLLWRAQEQEGWVSEPAIRVVADLLGMANIRVLEIATFYTMFQLEPVGTTAHIQVCGTTPCWLRGANDIKDVCRRRIHHDPHHLSEDGAFSWEEVECLGACVNAPLVQIGADTYEDLTAESFEKLIDDLATGRAVRPGPQIGRQLSAPVGGPTTLTDEAAYVRSSSNGGGAPLTDAEAKKPTEESAARETPAPANDIEAEDAKADPAPGADAPADEGTEPETLKEARDGKPDDLKRISGVGPKIEGLLNEMGIFHYDQIAAWTPAEVTWVDGRLKFKGRIEREDWIEQAKVLAAGGETEF